MITFISGRASSGKTTQVYNRIKSLAAAGENTVLIVPEQFSFESERAMLGILGEELLGYACVLPFSRIYETVGRITGGICGKVLTNADKRIIMDRAITSVADELLLWGKYSGSPSFSAQMLKSIDEFKFAGISSTELSQVAAGLNEGKLKSKIHDTALISDAYTALLGTSFIDPSDYMDKLYDMLEGCDYFRDKNVFFDGFKSFTGQQFKIIDRITAAAKSVTFTFIDDKNDTRACSLLTNVRKTKDRIQRILRAHGLTLTEDIFLSGTHFRSDGVKALENALFTGDFSDKTEKTDITVCEADTVYDEAEFVARTIRKTVREEGASFSDFVVIARETEAYEDALAVACKRNGVNIFIDKKIPLSSMPISVLVSAAIEFAVKPTAKSIFDFYKSGIAGLTTEEISTLEAYVYVWGIKAPAFKSEWDMNPKGLTDMTCPEMENELSRLNDLRARAIAPLADFSERYRGTPKQRARAIFDLLDAVDVKNQLLDLTKYYESAGELTYSDILKQSYSQFISLLDSIVDCFPDVPVSKPAFFDAIRTVLSLNSVGVAPQTLDEVVFGAADRIRPARPKYAFVIGVNQGVFPRISASGGLFTNVEISALKERGFRINDRGLDLAIDEQFLIYGNLCCASDKVFISCSKALSDNSPALPSPLLKQICGMNVRTFKEPDRLCEENLPETPGAAAAERLNRLNDAPGESAVIYEAIKDRADALPCDLDGYRISAEDARLSGEMAERLYGNEIRLSATKLETFSLCRFKYFCRYIANASPAEIAEISPLKRGTIIHYVLEKIIDEHKEDIAAMTPRQISDAVDKYCTEYLGRIPGYKTFETARIRFIIFTISRTLKEVVTRIAVEFAQSQFKPVGCEVAIGGASPVSADIRIDAKRRILLNGSVDRVDSYNENVRIVDYKMSGKDFSFSEILEGVNMQMLVYLYAVTKSNLYGSVPAGILYSNVSRKKKKKSLFDGLIVSDPDIVEAMEQENKGEFIPRYNKDKPSGSYISHEDYAVVLDYVNGKLREVGKEIFSGDISARPLCTGQKSPCDHCEFATVCRIDEKFRRTVSKLTSDEVIERMKRGDGSAV